MIDAAEITGLFELVTQDTEAFEAPYTSCRPVHREQADLRPASRIWYLKCPNVRLLITVRERLRMHRIGWPVIRRLPMIKVACHLPHEARKLDGFREAFPPV